MHGPHKNLPKLLLCSRDQDSVATMQGAVFSHAGYPVCNVVAKKHIQEQIEKTPFDILVLNHTLSFADRKTLARRAKKHRPESGVLVLHHSGSLGNPNVDLAVDSRAGAKAMLKAVQRLERMLHARSHHYNVDHGPYFVVADSERNYTFVTDGVCDLLGYDRANFLELRIDDVVAGATQVTAPLFQQFVAQGAQVGRIELRHRSGKLVSVNYWAKAEPDGCMIANWEPVAAQEFESSFAKKGALTSDEH
jgi:hypothetical protein